MPHLITPLPPTQTAILQSSTGALTIASTSTPKPSSTQLLVRTHAVALNPTDYKMPLLQPSPGALAGCDFAGTIISLGSSVSAVRPDLQIGDRVCGAVHGSNPIDHGSGAFADFVVAEVGLVLKVPAAWQWEEAAAVGGIGWGTLGLALWEALGLEWRGGKGAAVLVYGGATATGTMACQVLKL